MAVRLSVIMVQWTPPTTSAQQLAQEVVGELIGLPGIDLTLVEPFGGLHEASTDRLTLGSLAGDVAVLDWHTPQETLGSLEGIEFEGKRAPHADDRDAPPPPAGSRRIYVFDLRQFSQTQDVIAALKKLNADRQVRAFTLGPLPVARPAEPRSPDAEPRDVQLGSRDGKLGDGEPVSKNAGKSGLPGVTKPDAMNAHGDPTQDAGDSDARSSVSPGQISVAGDQSPLEGQQPPSADAKSQPPGGGRTPGSEDPLDLDDLLDQLDRSDP